MGMGDPRGGPRLVCRILSKQQTKTTAAAERPSTRKPMSQRGRSTTATDPGHDGDNPLSHCAWSALTASGPLAEATAPWA
jgi:hypothetical protein